MADPTTNPIDPDRFALALESLPLDALHAKAAEISNSISHLKSSNEQMLPFADSGDQVCKEAMFENLAVIGRMNERIRMLRMEVEKRGYLWGQEEDGSGLNAREGSSVNGDGDGEVVPQVNGTGEASAVAEQRPSGRLTDEELRRRLEEQMADEDREDGVHL